MPIWNKSEECLDLDERRQEQLEKLQSTLNRVFRNVPFYRNLFEAGSLDPSDIRRLEDLQKLPFTVRSHFSENYPYGLFAVPLRDVVRIHTARGTASNPIVSGYTKKDLVMWRELVARALTAASVSSSDIIQIELDAGLANWGRDYKDGAEVIESGVIPLTVLSPEKQLMVLRDYRTSVLVTSPSGAVQFAEWIFRANLNPNAAALRTLILVGEMPEEDLRRRLEEQLHVTTWLNYGLSEVPGPVIAFECEEHRGLHVNEDHFYPEVIDPDTEEVLPVGEVGELVLTTLTTRAFPLIRLRTGDRVRLLEERCSCGRTLRKMDWYPLASHERIMIRGVKVLPQQIALLLERALGYLPDRYRFFKSREDFKDFLDIWLHVEERLFSDEIKGMEKLRNHVAEDLSQELGVPVRIRFKEHISFLEEAGSEHSS